MADEFFHPFTQDFRWGLDDMNAGKLTGKHYAFERLGEGITLISPASFLRLRSSLYDRAASQACQEQLEKRQIQIVRFDILSNPVIVPLKVRLLSGQGRRGQALWNKIF